MFRYRYFEAGTDKPLRRCPVCGHALTEEGGICLLLSIGGQVVEVASRLNEEGCLTDTEDGAVARGYHSGTHCGGCKELLLHVADEDEGEA